VIIPFTLQDEHWRQGDRLAALEDAPRIALENSVPWVEIDLAIFDQALALHLLRLLIAKGSR
jgi:hypothetical protein